MLSHRRRAAQGWIHGCRCSRCQAADDRLARVSLILHLSDLHLLPRGADEEIGDYKSKFVPIQHRQMRQDLLVDTLRGIRDKLTHDGDDLDAVVISGDVTTHGKRGGLDLLGGLLAELGDKLPPPERIVVVPGNHDVAYRSAPSSRERYKDFLETVGALGYVTPLLEGVDEEATQRSVVVLGDVVICAMNSADYAGALEPIDAKVQAQVVALGSATDAPTQLLEAFADSRLVDAARINAIQMRHTSDQLKKLDPDHRRVRIVTFHHQLHPVTLNEELKPYESFSNLAEIQAFLRSAEVDVVLHGHKHSAALLELGLASLITPEAPPHPCWVVSAGTVGGQVGVGHEAAKLLRIDAPLRRTRTMTVYSVPALSSAGRLESLTAKHAVVASPTMAPSNARQVVGRTIADVHEQLELDLFRESLNGPLVCIVEEPAPDAPPPDSYPPVPPSADVAAWFQGQVAWWQSHTLAEGKPFTHGDYIRRWHGIQDQLTHVIEVLRNSPNSSRGLISLYDPDRLSAKESTFPSFSVLHFKLRDNKLELIAFFRKQEMRYWWAINATEIAGLQAEVVAALSQSGRRVTAGPVLTICAEAVFSDVLPKVAVPVLDQYAWGDSAEIARIAMAVYDEHMPQRTGVLTDACRILEELMPPEEMPEDGPYVSVAGPAKLLDLLNALRTSYPSANGQVTSFITRLDALVDKHRSGRDLERGDRPSEYPAWAAASRAHLKALVNQLREMAGTD
jgi:3',5'-cyclic AMP phosphodiesterase CpdA